MQWAKRNGSTEYAASKRKRIQIDVANAVDEFDHPTDVADAPRQWENHDVSTASPDFQNDWGSGRNDIAYNQSPSDQPRYMHQPDHQGGSEGGSAWDYYSGGPAQDAGQEWGNGHGYTKFGPVAQNTSNTSTQQGSQQRYGGASYEYPHQVNAPRHNAPSTDFQSTMQPDNESVTMKQILPAILVAGVLVLVTVLTLFA